MRKAYTKEIARSISHSLGRFLAIAVIAALGTGFFAGLRMTGPDMRLAADRCYDGTALYDLRVVSTVGLSDENVETLRGIEGVEEVMPSKETDVLATMGDVQCTVRIHSIDKDAAASSSSPDGVVVESDEESYLNRPILTEGRWPSDPNECVVSSDAVMDKPLSIGDKVSVLEGANDLDGVLEVREYTVVGFVRSSNYACFTNLGSTSLGNGTIDQYMFVPEESFSEDGPYTEAFVTVLGAAEEDASSEDYASKVSEVAKRIEEAAPGLESERISQLKANAQEELDESKEEYEKQKADAEAKIAQAREQLDSAKSQLDSSAAQLDEAKASLESSAATIAASESELESGESEYQSALERFQNEKSSALAQLGEAQSQIDAQRPQVEEGLAQLDALRSAISSLEAQIAVLDPASSEYAQAVAQRDALSSQVAQIEAAAAELDAAQSALDERRSQAEASFAAAQTQLDSSRARLDEGWAQLEAGKSQRAQGAASLEEGTAKYEEGLAEYQRGVEELASEEESARAEFAEAEMEIDEAQEKIDSLDEAELLVLDRTKNVGVESFKSDSYRIDNIAQVFPVIFFLVAALVSLTTMTRMVEEQRVLIGTYKALGYGKGRIAAKYLVYAFVASGVGSLVGIAGFSQFLPWFIQNAYGVTYAVPVGATPVDPAIALASAGLGIGITLAATAGAAFSSLRETPSALMLPRTPKAGKRIMLERVGPLWRRMSFSWKVTARNIFRYKRRFFMAIVGIAGCTALLLTGLGLQNAINDIIDKQFYEVYDYSLTVSMDDDATEEELEEVEKTLSEERNASAHTLVSTENVIATSETDVDGQRIELVVPSDLDEIGDYVHFRERVGRRPIDLSENSVVISEKLATHLGVSVGDEISLQEEDSVGNATGAKHNVVVNDIMENYVGQFVFMGSEAYAEAFGEDPSYRTYYAKATEDESVRQELSDELLDMDGVKTVGYNDETISMYKTMLKSVDSVVVILVVAAAALAFVVLYNLNNINITERQREVATLKVLGFTHREVDAYIYRETALLSMIGAALGLVLGVFMEQYVVITVEVDQVMFGREIHPTSFIVAYVLTMVFTVLVMLAMRKKLRSIDMVESLKSVE